MKLAGPCLFFCLLSVGVVQAAPLEYSPFGGVVASIKNQPDRSGPTDGNQVLMLSGGYDALLVRIHLIRQARKSIDIQTFIWSNDECGRLLMYELIEAAKRGVKVRIIADTLFSEQEPAIVAFCATAHPNLEIKHYRPVLSRLKASRLQLLLSGLFSFRGLNQRMHNKVMLFDDTVLITGGRNMENSYFDHATGLNYRDRDVLAIGPVVQAATRSFTDFWKYRHTVPSLNLIDVRAIISSGNYRRYERREDYDFGGFFSALDREADDASLIAERFTTRLRPVEQAKFISDVPGKKSGYFSQAARITRELRSVLNQAREQITIQTPYLVLSRPAREMIMGMKAKYPELRIRVSTNSFASTDNIIAYSANYRLRSNYIESLRLEVYEFKPQPDSRMILFPRYPEMLRLSQERKEAEGRSPFLCMHAKSLSMDDRIAFIGSYNLDPRSENLNTEAGLLIEDAVLARELREEIEADIRPENSWVIARRILPLRLDVLNGLVDGVLSLSPIDVWPIQNSSSYELLPGATEVPPGDPAFYEHYREVGSFPGAEGSLSAKEILTRIYKAVGPTLTPIL